MITPFVTDLKSNVRSAMIGLLNQQLADALDLKLALKQAHWNIRGSEFIALHELFDQVAARIEEHSDTMAERVVQLGGLAAGTTQSVATATTFEPYPLEATTQKQQLEALRARLAGYAKSCRKAIDASDEAGDVDTADIMTGVSRAVDWPAPRSDTRN
jgi:starvation-inducible DNA-binding protein